MDRPGAYPEMEYILSCAVLELDKACDYCKAVVAGSILPSIKYNSWDSVRYSTAILLDRPGHYPEIEYIFNGAVLELDKACD